MNVKELYLTSINHAVITLYIKPDTDKQKMINLLKREEPLLDNIQSRITRDEIKTAFQSLKTFLSRMQPSKNGYIIVANAQELVFITEILVTSDMYKCGNEFYSKPLEDTLAVSIYPVGIIALDTKEATIARISDKIEILKTMTSGIPGKSHKGGSSQRRYERERDMAVSAFFKRIGDTAKLFVEQYPIEELFISGCGRTKEDFVKTKYLDYRLKAKISGTLDTQYTGEEGIRETMQKALPQLQKNAYAREVQTMQIVFDLLGADFEKVVYGLDNIKEHISSIKKIIQIEEMPDFQWPVETTILHFHGEHYDRLKGIGGIVGLK